MVAPAGTRSGGGTRSHPRRAAHVVLSQLQPPTRSTGAGRRLRGGQYARGRGPAAPPAMVTSGFRLRRRAAWAIAASPMPAGAAGSASPCARCAPALARRPRRAGRAPTQVASTSAVRTGRGCRRRTRRGGVRDGSWSCFLTSSPAGSVPSGSIPRARASDPAAVYPRLHRADREVSTFASPRSGRDVGQHDATRSPRHLRERRRRRSSATASAVGRGLGLVSSSLRAASAAGAPGAGGRSRRSSRPGRARS